MKSLLLLVILFTTSLFSQKISSDNPTYINIDHDMLKDKISGFPKSIGEAFFSAKELPKNAQTVGISLKEKFVGDMAKVDLFVLDTNQNNGSLFYANSEYFSSMNSVDATGKKGEFLIAEYTSKLSKKMDPKNLVLALIHSGVIQTYMHLNAEMVVASEKKGEVYEIQFSAVHHYCTNDCYDPKYKFGVRIDKKASQVWLVK